MSIITENTGFNDGDIVYCDKHNGAHEVTVYCTWCVSAEPEGDTFRVYTLTDGKTDFDRTLTSRLHAEMEYTARVLHALQQAWVSNFRETSIIMILNGGIEREVTVTAYQTTICRACNEVIAWNPVGMEWVSRYSDRVEHYVNICSAQFGGHSPRV